MNLGQDAATIAVEIANDNSHGYDQENRWGPDFDCSSLIISIYRLLGVDLTCTYTGNMKADFLRHGFADVTAFVNLQSGKGLIPGDVLLNEKHHTAIVVSSGKIVAARINEKGTVTGGKSGDQNGNEICEQAYYNYPWDCVLRLNDTIEVENGEISGFPWVQNGSIGINVYAVQAALAYLGFLTVNDLDAICGRRTVVAIKAFQTASALEVDGIAGNKTLYKLFNKEVT